MLCRLDPFQTALAIALAFLGGVKPIEGITPVIGEIAALKEVERLGCPRIIGLGSTPEQVFGDRTRTELIIKPADLYQIVGKNGDSFAAVIDDVLELFLGAKFAIGNVEEIGRGCDRARPWFLCAWSHRCGYLD